MSIAGDLIRGHTDAIILARLLRGDSYGYEINKTISTLSPVGSDEAGGFQPLEGGVKGGLFQFKPS